jgi:hypothetical protein
MAERLETLPAIQVARVRFPVPARPTFSVEKLLFSVTDKRVGGSSFFGRKGGGHPLNFDPVRPILPATRANL